MYRPFRAADNADIDECNLTNMGLPFLLSIFIFLLIEVICLLETPKTFCYCTETGFFVDSFTQ